MTNRVTRYQKAHTIQLNLRLSKKYDQDIIEHLQTVPANATYIKQLIRDDIGRGDKRV